MAGKISPAFATRLSSSKVTSSRSIERDTRPHRKCLLELRTMTTSNTVIVPAREALSADTRLYSAATPRWIEAKSPPVDEDERHAD